MCTKGIRGQVSINSPDRYSIDTPSTPWLTLDQQTIDISVDSWQLTGESWLIFDRFIWANQHLADYWLTFDQVSIECRPSVNSDVDQGYQLTLDRGYL